MSTITPRNCARFIAAVVLVTIATAQEKKIQRSDLPQAVEKTVVAESQGATIHGFSQEKKKGRMYYEAELLVKHHSKDILMEANGAVVEVEEEIAIDSLPSAVKNGLQARAKLGKLLKVESITKHNKLVAYEAQVTTGGTKSEVQIGPDGKPLNHEE